MARPTSLTPGLIEKAQDYLDNYPDLDELVPTVAGLSLHLGVSRKIIYVWEESEQTPVTFLHILEAIKAKQETRLVNGGLGNQFNSTIAKMMLTKHGYSDKQEIDHSSSNGTMTPAQVTPVSEETLNKLIDKL